MKSSGIEWIGNIPDDWEVKKLKYVAELDPTISEFLGDNDIVSFAPMECLGEQTLSPYETEYGKVKGKYTYFANEDIIMAKVTPCFENGNIAIAKNLKNNVGFGSSELFVFRAKNISNSFLMYSLYSEPFKSLAKSTMYGTGGLKRVSPEFILNYKIPFPPLKTQEKIADYLDEKCGEIDATITKQKESIEKLKAYKQSLISETVTKGLDKSAPLKPSGIKWLGEIPQNARIIRLRFLSSIQTGDKDTANRVENGKYPFYVRSPIVERIDTFSFDGEAILMAGDGVGAGKVFHYVNGKFDYHQRVYNIHNLKGVLGKFLYYYLRENFYKEIEQSNAKSTVDSIRLPMLLDFPIIVYPYDLQKEIVSFLDKKVAEIDAIIIKKQNIIQKLDAYKKSLIFECVTGKQKI